MFALTIVACSVALSMLSAKVVTAADILNVHLIPHTHDDPGWLKTVDEYYYGSNSSIYKAGVQYILDSVVTSLAQDPSRTFVYVEMSFFQRWYSEQQPRTREIVKRLVKNGQLTFANGGWCMHDEAASHFVSMIDQTTLGHRFLHDEFGYTPTVGWQIDPFGHSSTHASLLSSEVGFDSLFFGRIDYEDLQLRSQEKRLEFVWRGAESLPKAQVFTGVFSDGNYQPPSGFCYDAVCGVDPVMDDPLLENNNVELTLANFVAAIQSESAKTMGNNIGFKMGSDFQYTNANQWFVNLDKIVKLMNERYPNQYHVFYSNPTMYTKAKADEMLTWTTKTDDFFPYADCAHCYWGGYFTSRPTLKYLERSSSSFLQVLKQFSVTQFSFLKDLTTAAMTTTTVDSNGKSSSTRKPPKDALTSSPLFELTAGVGLVNHHDAITGTSKQHVAYDYIKILSKAFTNAEHMLSRVVERFLFVKPNKNNKVETCRLSNESICDLTEKLVLGTEAVVVAYNPLPRVNTQMVQVILNSNIITQDVDVFVLTASTDKEPLEFVYAELLPPNQDANSFSKNVSKLFFFATNVPALSTKQFIVQLKQKERLLGKKAAKVLEEVVWSKDSEKDLRVSNYDVELTFASDTGLLKEMTRHISKEESIHAKISQTIGFYISYGTDVKGNAVDLPKLDNRDPHLKNLEPAADAKIAEASTQRSGAYIFRPQTMTQLQPVVPEGEVVQLKVVQGLLVSEVRQVFSSWVTQTVQLLHASSSADFYWTVGPIPVDDKVSKEVVSRFSSDIPSGHTFYTDANGREFQQRIKNYRETWNLTVTEPIAGNYYPITQAAYLKSSDDSERSSKRTLGVLTDRSQGTASLHTGQLEMMIHRRLLTDDSRGVDEPLDETDIGMTPYPTWIRLGDGIIVSGRHRLVLSTAAQGVQEIRTEMDKLFNPLAMFYSQLEVSSNDVENDLLRRNLLTKSYPSPLAADLPLNVQLVTLEQWNSDTVLLRLAHAYAVDEDDVLSTDVTVDVKKLLAPLLQGNNDKKVSIEEMSLSANQLYETMLAKKIHWKTDTATPVGRSRKSTDPWQVTLSPMEVKTFLIHTGQH